VRGSPATSGSGTLVTVTSASTVTALPFIAVATRFQAIISQPTMYSRPPRLRATYISCWLLITALQSVCTRPPSPVSSRHIRPWLMPLTHIEAT
jgi:hypothetical protein